MKVPWREYERWKNAAISNFDGMYAAWLILIDIGEATADMHAAMKDAAYYLDWVRGDADCTKKRMYEEGRLRILRKIGGLNAPT